MPILEHVRALLDMAGGGPGPTHGVLLPLMEALATHGAEAAVIRYLAPSPGDDAPHVAFDVRRAGALDPYGWRGDSSLPLIDALRTAGRLVGADAVEVWSINGGGLERLILAGDRGESLSYVAPEPGRYKGDPAEVALACAAWESESPVEPETPDTRVAPETPVPPVAPATGALPDDQANLTDALRDALAHVRVEVDLGAIEDLVVDALRGALADLPRTLWAEPAPEEVDRPAEPEILALTPAPPHANGPDDPDPDHTDPDDSDPGPEEPTALPRGMDQLASVIAAGEAGPWASDAAGAPDDLARVLASGLRPLLEEQTQRLLVRLVSTDRTEGGLQRLTDQIDWHMREVEIVVNTLTSRLRALLEEQSQRFLRRSEAATQQDREVLERVERRMQQVERELRRRAIPEINDPPAPTLTEEPDAPDAQDEPEPGPES